MIWMIGGWLILAPLAVFAVFVIAIAIGGARMRTVAAERTAQDAKLADFTTETHAAINTEKGQASEQM